MKKMNFSSKRGKIKSMRTTKPIAEGAIGEEKKRFDKAAAARGTHFLSCTELTKHSIIVIGAGSGGLVIAIGAAKAGKRVLLIERGEFGGDCTNYGCIPSKTLIAAARKHLDSAGALSHAREIVERVRSHEEPAALKQLGVTTLRGEAHFKSDHVLEVVDKEGKSHIVKGKKIVIATGSSPNVPPIDGLKGTPYLTNETIFSLKEAPKTLAILGGGPIGCELAQTFARLGSKVHLIHRHDALLAKEEPKAQELIAKEFHKEGIELHFNTTISAVTHQNGQFNLTLSQEKLQSDALLIAIGRRPNISALHLDAAHVEHTHTKIPTDRFGRTNQKHIFAIGDVRGGPFFTHLAESQARSVLTSLLLPFSFLKKLSMQAIPRVTFTDPEVASCGLTIKEAEKLYPSASLKTYTLEFSDLDRAICEGREEGFISIVTKKWSSKILGVTIAGPRAGEMLGQVTLAMLHGIPLRKLSRLIVPYPTYNLAIRKVADMWLTSILNNFSSLGSSEAQLNRSDRRKE